MLRIITLISAILLSSIFSSILLAAEVSPTTTETSLELKSLKVVDSRTIRALFSEDIDATSVVLKIAQQSNNSAVDVALVNQVADTPDTVDISLDEDMEEGTSYTMTILAAVWVSGSTITDGASALKEFVTPSPLKKSEDTLNAPQNPNAATVKNDTPKITPVEEELPPEEKIEEEIVPTEELPLTWMNPLIFLLIAFTVAFLFLRKKTA